MKTVIYLPDETKPDLDYVKRRHPNIPLSLLVRTLIKHWNSFEDVLVPLATKEKLDERRYYSTKRKKSSENVV